MITRDPPYLTVDTFLEVVVKMEIPLLSLVCYMVNMVSDTRYLPRGSNENTLCITTTGYVFVNRWAIPLVTIPFLDFVMIHQVC